MALTKIKYGVLGTEFTTSAAVEAAGCPVRPIKK